MKTSRSAKKTTASTDASVESKLSELILMTYRKNKSKMKTLTEVDLTALLERAMVAADQPLPDYEFDPSELDYDPDLDPYPIPSKTSEASSATTPSKVSTSKSKSITLRIPGLVLAAIKAEAIKTGTPYQTYINRSLRLAIVR